MTTTTSAQVITCLGRYFARYGIPKCLVSDCGPQFTSREFKKFVDQWGVSHIKSSPGHHQSNGKAEAGVKSIKNLLKKTNGDQYLALLELRNTLRQDTNQSPAELMYDRSTRSTIPHMTKKPRNCDRQYQKQRSNYRRGIRNSQIRKFTL